MKISTLRILFIGLMCSVFTFVNSSCTPNIDRTIPVLSPKEKNQLENFRRLNSQFQVSLCEESEPGETLWLCLKFIDKESKAPLINQQVKLYQTSANGTYDPVDADDESTARINGVSGSNADGMLFIRTILPGDYGSSEDNRHIHTTVTGAHPEAYDIHFKQYTGKMGRRFIENSDQHFLADLRRTSDSTLVAFVTIKVKNPDVSPVKTPNCEWCGASEAPPNINWQARIAPEDEPGTRLVLEGTIYESDGITPAPGVIVYAYHTNIEGIYPVKGNETGNGKRHGYLRGWALTNNLGQYQFTTIKPAPYPSRNEPAHIHMTLLRNDFEEYWIGSTVFKGDPLINDEVDSSQIISLKESEKGTLYGQRNIILKSTHRL